MKIYKGEKHDWRINWWLEPDLSIWQKIWYTWKDTGIYQIYRSSGLAHQIYKLKCWAWHRYTTVKPRTLDHTWADRDELLEHCIFEIVRKFLENEAFRESIPNIVARNVDPSDKVGTAWIRLHEILNWYDEYLKWKPETTIPKGTPYRTRLIDEASKQKRDELTAYLKEIIELREHMWT